MKKILLILIALISLIIIGVVLVVMVWSSSKDDRDIKENPDWVNEIVNGTKTYNRWDQYETSVSKCSYRGEVAYYITYGGDDLYNDLFNIAGNKICSPSGGFSGNGDGQCSDFSASKNNCQLIWEKLN